ncbi:hypothetical protein [Hymenobacter ruber]
MTKQEVNVAIRLGKLPAMPGWYGGFLVLFYCLCFCAIGTVFIFDRPLNPYAPAGLLLWSGLSFYTLYCLLTERNLTPLKTNLSAGDNHQLIIHVFNVLGWQVSSITQLSIIAKKGSNWFGIPVHATVLVEESVVYLNLMNGGGNIKGRLPFSFGRNEQKLRLLIDKINKSRQLAK